MGGVEGREERNICNTFNNKSKVFKWKGRIRFRHQLAVSKPISNLDISLSTLFLSQLITFYAMDLFLSRFLVVLSFLLIGHLFFLWLTCTQTLFLSLIFILFSSVLFSHMLSTLMPRDRIVFKADDSLSCGHCGWEEIMSKWSSSNACNCWGWASRLHREGEAWHFRGRSLWSEICRMRRTYLGQSTGEECIRGREHMNSKFEKFEETQSYWDIKRKESKKEGWRAKQWPNNPASCKKKKKVLHFF